MTALDDAVSPVSPVASVAAALERIENDDRAGIWIERFEPDRVLADAHRVEAALAAGADLPLAGTTLAVKNNIDVQGLRTTAGCKTFGRVPATHAPVVDALVAAGAIVIGVTNLDQFATGLVGTRSPFGICPNAHWPGLIAGGSSSGSAVAVATGHVDLALGTDTAGSGRVPAAANGIIGLKPTRARLSTAGIVPACPSFDCVSLFGRDSQLLRRAFATLSPPTPSSSSPHRGLRGAIPHRRQLHFDGDAEGAARFEAAVEVFTSAVASSVSDVDLAPFLAAGELLYQGAFVRERHDAVGRFIDAHPDDIDPTVYRIIHRAGAIPRSRLAEDQAELDRLAALTRPFWTENDLLVVPTVPRIPTIAEVQAEPIAVNSMLGTYTNFVNLLDLCAVALPVGTATDDGPPASLMLIAPAGRDELLLDLADAILQAEPR